MTHPHYISGTWTVPPGEMVAVNRSAEFLTCLNAASPFRIRIGSGPETDFEQGLTFRSDRSFDRVEIVNPHAQELSVTLGFGRGDIHDNRLVISSAGGGISTRERTELRPLVQVAGKMVDWYGDIQVLENYCRINPGNRYVAFEFAPENIMRKSLHIFVQRGPIEIIPETNSILPKAGVVMLQSGDSAEIPGTNKMFAASQIRDKSAYFVVFEEVYL